jgi:hypothetical protein
MALSTLTWWWCLCGVSLLNVMVWSASVARIQRRRALHHPVSGAATRIQILLSGGYVLGCAYRSAFPVYDLQRLCLVDSWLSSVFVGRSVATLAELCSWYAVLTTSNGGHVLEESIWESEVVWMSLYFSVAVWFSIGLIHAPGFLGSYNGPVAIEGDR